MWISYLRALFVTDPLIVLATAVMGSISLLVSLFDSGGHTQHKVARAWARILLWVSGVRVRVEGLEKLSSHGSYVFASNHLSYMDTPVVVASVPLQFRFLAKKSLFKVPFIGYHLSRAGHIPVPREDARASVKAMTEAARVINNRGISVLVFPEGGRSEGQLQEFREGAAYIAIRAGVPVVPLTLRGTRHVLPMGSVNVRAGEVTLTVGEPISTEGLKTADRGELTRRLRDQVVEMLASKSDSG